MIRHAALILALCALAPLAASQTNWTAGNLTNSWNDGGNWDAGVPDSVTDAVIPSSASIFPGSYSGAPVTANLTIQSGASMTLGGGFDLTVSGNLVIGGTLTVTSGSSDIDVSGDWTNNGTFTSSTATVELTSTGALDGSSATSFEDLVVTGGTRTVSTGFTVTGNFELEASTTLAIGTTTCSIAGDWISSGGSAAVTGTGVIEFTSTGTTTTGSNSLPNAEVSGGTRTFSTSDVAGDLDMTGGDVVIGDSATLTVGGTVNASGGSLGWATNFAGLDTLDVAGSVILSGTSAGTTSADSRLLVAGGWSSDSSWDPTNGTTEFDGGTTATIGGTAPNFFNLVVVDGDKNFVSATDIDGTLDIGDGATLDSDAAFDVAGVVSLGDNSAVWDAGTSTHTLRAGLTSEGADVTGIGILDFVGAGAAPLGDGTVPLTAFDVPNVTLTSGTLTLTSLTVNGDLTMDGGELNIFNNQTITVTGDADLNAGNLDWQDINAGTEVLDVAGAMTLTATDGGANGGMDISSRINVAGTWTSDATWQPALGTVALDGGTNVNIDATDLPNVQIVSGIKTFITATNTAGNVTVSDGATLDADAALDIDGGVTLGDGTSAWDLGLLTHTVAGSFASTGGSATSAGAGTVEFDGAGNTNSGGGTIANMTVSAGARTAGATTILGDLNISGGSFEVNNDATVSVAGDLGVTGGSLGWTSTVDATVDVLDVEGSVTLATTAAGNSTTASRLRAAGDFTSDGSFAPLAGVVELDGPGGSTVAGAAPAFADLRLVSDRTISSATAVTGDLTIDDTITLTSTAALDVDGDVSLDATSTWDLGNPTHTVAGIWTSLGGSATSGGTGRVNFDGGGGLDTGGGSIAAMLVSDGIRACATSSILGDVELNGATATLRINNNATLSVGGNADLLLGSLSFFVVADATPDVLDVEGDMDVQVGVSTSSTDAAIRVAGNWLSDATYAPTDGVVELDGGTTTTVAGPTLANLTVVSGTKTQSGTTVVGSDLTVAAGANLTLATTASDLDVSGNTVIEGTLAIDDNDIQVAGDWTSNAVGAAVTGTASVDLTAGGNIVTGANSVPNILVSGGTRTADDTLTTNLDVAAGATLDINDNATVSVTGNATLAAASTLIFSDSTAGNETLDVTGDVSMEATAGGESANARFEVEGNWTSTSAWAPADGTVVLDGGAATFGGTAPQVHHLLVDAGVKTVTVATLTTGNVDVSNGATLDTDAVMTITGDVGLGDNSALWDIAGLTHTIAGDYTSAGADASGLAAGTLQFTASGLITGGGGSIQNVLASGGVRNFNTVDILGNLDNTAGTLRINNDANVTVGGDLGVTAGGKLEFFGTPNASPDILDIAGAATIDGVSGFSSTDTMIKCAGNWSSTPLFDPANGTVELDGGTTTTMGGTTPTLPNLRIVSGTKTVNAATSLSGDLTVDDGATLDTDAALDVSGDVVLGDGTASWDTGALTHILRGSVTSSGADATDGAVGSTLQLDGFGAFGGSDMTVDNVVIVTGIHTFFNTEVTGDVSMTTGAMNIQDNQEVTVAGDVTLSAGNISFIDSSAGNEILDIEGNMTMQANSVTTSANMLIECAGDWTADGTFTPAAGTTRLDGAGTTTMAGVVPGDTVGFFDLIVTNGIRSAGNDFDLDIDTITIDSGAELDLNDKRVEIPGSTVLVNGDLSIGSAGELALGSAAVMSVSSVGTLNMIGTAGLPAAIRGATAGGGYFLTIDGFLEATQFEFADMGAAGVIIGQSATLGSIPNDLRAGTFANPSATPGSTMLDIRRLASTDIRFVNFEDPLGDGTNNVRTLGGSDISFTNSSGNFAGEAFDDDPFNLVSWSTDVTIIVDFFAKAGLDKVTLDWETFTEVDVDDFVIKRATNFGGPFTEIHTTPALGAPNNYQHIDNTVVAGQFYVYQLIERLSVGVDRFIAQRTATPWGATIPANILDVGPGGSYADIDAAIADAGSVFNPVIRIEPGTYPPFTVGALFGTLRIFGDGTGTVTIDTTAAPVQIINLTASGAVHIGDITIGSALTTNPGILIQNSAGLVTLDDLDVTGGIGSAGIRVDNSDRVAIDRTDLLGGTPSLLVEGGSTAYLQGGSATSITANGSSTVRTRGITGHVSTPDGSSTIENLGGVPIELDMPHFAGLGQPINVTINGDPNGTWFLFFSFDVDWLDLRGAGQNLWEHVFLVDLPSGGLLTFAPIPGSGTITFPGALPSNAVLLGFPVVTQIISLHPGTAQQNLSNVATMIGMPQ